MRIGVSPYLNACPLTRGLANEAGVELVESLPARLADLLRARNLDVALVSSSEYFCGNYRIVPVGGISSAAAGADAVLYSNVPITLVRRVALSAGSRSTNLMLQLILNWLNPGAAVSYEIRPEDAVRSLSELDACLLIGDCTLEANQRAEYCYDLTLLWQQHTGLPMVFSLWLARPGTDPAVVETLQAARQRGRAELEQIIEEESRSRGLEQALVRRYLTESLDYSWTSKHERALQEFGRALYQAGLVPHFSELAYLGEEDAELCPPVETNHAM
ncbi:menaquinone biosynthesis protein [bacterium]|nr:menaquinone biosynthesis protein [bacterium]